MLRLLLVSLFVALAVGKSINGSDADFDSRIIGGRRAVAGQFPYQVTLFIGGFLCGGSIISDTWIVTAAHCTYGRSASVAKVVVGSILLSSGGTVHSIAKVINHPSYTDTSSYYDISLIATSRKIKFSATVNKIPLATPSDILPDNSPALASGWGLISQNPDETPENLQYLVTRVTSKAECSRYHNIRDSNLCTLLGPGQSVCMGDSGGPLVYNGKLVGIVSYGPGDCGSGYPDVWTRVSSYSDWIKQKTGI